LPVGSLGVPRKKGRTGPAAEDARMHAAMGSRESCPVIRESEWSITPSRARPGPILPSAPAQMEGVESATGRPARFKTLPRDTNRNPATKINLTSSPIPRRIAGPEVARSWSGVVHLNTVSPRGWSQPDSNKTRAKQDGTWQQYSFLARPFRSRHGTPQRAPRCGRASTPSREDADQA